MSDKKKRDTYDVFGEEGLTRGGYGGGFGGGFRCDPNDNFGDDGMGGRGGRGNQFGGGRPGGSQTRQEPLKPGANREVNLRCSLEDLYTGATKTRTVSDLNA